MSDQSDHNSNSENHVHSPTGTNGTNGTPGLPGTPGTTEVNGTPAPAVNASLVIQGFTLNETVVQPGVIITNQQGTGANGEEITKTTFETTADGSVNVTENLTNVVTNTFTDDAPGQNPLYDEIKLYAGKIACSSFHGKGTIDDYKELFTAAANIAVESKGMQLNVDIDGFADFGQAADDLAALFTSFITKLQTVSIIDDTVFLAAVASALRKISHLADVFGRFKDTILATTTVRLPTSAGHTAGLMNGVLAEVNCAMNYINHFVAPGPEHLPEADLSALDKNILTTAVATIHNWNALCDQGVTIAMTTNPDIVTLRATNTALKAKAATLAAATLKLRSKLGGVGDPPLPPFKGI